MRVGRRRKKAAAKHAAVIVATVEEEPTAEAVEAAKTLESPADHGLECELEQTMLQLMDVERPEWASRCRLADRGSHGLAPPGAAILHTLVGGVDE